MIIAENNKKIEEAQKKLVSIIFSINKSFYFKRHAWLGRKKYVDLFVSPFFKKYPL